MTYPPGVRAVVIERPGGPEVLTWGEVPDPSPAAGEVLVRVRASAVNRADLLQRAGFYNPPPGATEIPGLECSGTVAAVGDGVSGWSVGDEVCALLAGGGYAELVAVPAGQLLPVPAGVGLRDAAALPEVACTVWSTVVREARLSPGELLLIHGGASGIGTFAIQLAVALGVRVAVTAGSAEKLDRCRRLGAEVAVNYRDEDFVERVHAASDGRGADVVLDIMGASYLARNLDVLAPDGRLVIIGLQGGRRAELDLNRLLSRRGTLYAASLRARPAEQKAGIVAGVREEVWPLVAQGRIRPVIDRVLPMDRAAQAHAVLEESSHVGKVVLEVPGSGPRRG